MNNTKINLRNSTIWKKTKKALKEIYGKLLANDFYIYLN